MAIDKLEEKLCSEFKIMQNKFVKINSDYYLGGEHDLFDNKSVKQIHFILFCLCLCDNRIQVYRERTNDSVFMPEFVSIEIKREDYRVFKVLYGSHLREFLKIDKNFCMKSENDYLFVSIEDEEGINITINTKIIRYIEDKKYTSVWIGDILSTKKLASLFIKLKCYTFLDIKDYIEGYGRIYDNNTFNVMFLKEDFERWTSCGHRHKQYIIESIQSMNKENDFKVHGAFCIKPNSINLKINTKSFSDHVKQNCINIENKFSGKTQKSTIKGSL